MTYRPNQGVRSIFVRRMQRCFVFAVLLLLAFTSCTSMPIIYAEAGRNYTLSPQDVAEINALIASRRDIRKPIGVVYMKSPTRADVSSGNTSEPFGEVTLFTIYKKNGRWMIDESSVRQDRAIVIS